MIKIDTRILEEFGLTEDKALLLLAITKNPKILELIQTLMKENWLENKITNNYLVLKPAALETLDMVVARSKRKEKPVELDYNGLADKLRDIYPKGRKKTPDGRSFSWRDTTPVIAQKLKTLVHKYGFKFTEEQAIEAVRNYVEKNMDNPYMQVLKYYLLKTTIDGIKSDFMSDIQNKEDEEGFDNDWTTQLL